MNYKHLKFKNKRIKKCFLTILVMSSFVCFSQHQNEIKNTTDLSNITELKLAIEKTYPHGAVKFTPDSKIKESELLDHLSLGNEVTFRLFRERKSRFNQNDVFRYYKQFYKGLEVEAGGYTVKVATSSISEKSFIKLFLPNIYAQIELNVVPEILETDLSNLLNVDKVFKSIVFKYGCEFWYCKYCHEWIRRCLLNRINCSKCLYKNWNKP